METIAEAKAYLRANYEKGTTCPCCGQYVKLYRRKITSSMAYAIIMLYKNQRSGAQWTHIQEYLKPLPIPAAVFSCGVTTLTHWGLLEAKEGAKDDGNPNNGIYRVTERGVDFVLGRIEVADFALIYKDRVKGWSVKNTTIQRALKNKFNYLELMS